MNSKLKIKDFNVFTSGLTSIKGGQGDPPKSTWTKSKATNAETGVGPCTDWKNTYENGDSCEDWDCPEA